MEFTDFDVKLSHGLQIGGIYHHYKGQQYTVYCVAFDMWGNAYVLYRQEYQDRLFWLRPYGMFFDKVKDENGKEEQRFSINKKQYGRASSKIADLVKLLEKTDVEIHSSENSTKYSITKIDTLHCVVFVHPSVIMPSSGYLTDFELARRMGYRTLVIDDDIKIYQSTTIIPERLRLKIGDNSQTIISEQMNPCSIDLQIADSVFLRTKLSSIDPLSIEHIANSHSLWKTKRIHRSKKNNDNYIVLRPMETVITRTKDIITIPADCAGKIEVKSTYARLSISVTSGDFCNPGYCGKFPLEITNHGLHSIYLHSGDTMAQLMLIPLSGPVLCDYSKKATFKDKSGIDDGMPFSFWQERRIKSIRKTSGTDVIIRYYNYIRETITGDDTEDVNAFLDRFQDNFLVYCQKRLKKPKFTKANQPDLNKLVHSYIDREKLLEKLCSLKWLYPIFIVLTNIMGWVIPPIVEKLLDDGKLKSFFSVFLVRSKVVLMAIGLISIPLWFVIKKYIPNVFCTLRKRNIDKDINHIEKLEK